jgi:hypothetical protein
MRNALFFLLLMVSPLTSCKSDSHQGEAKRALVYEGMPASELRSVLGEPLKIETKPEIINGQTMQKMSLEHWIYDKRTVVLINDTVKNANIN